MVGQTAKSTSPIALAGTCREQRSRKRDASARYSALQGSSNTAKAGGTTRRPLVLQMDRGRILFSGVNQLADDMEQAS
jgi:hypothetical protein